jgi:hypothetical protein
MNENFRQREKILDLMEKNLEIREQFILDILESKKGRKSWFKSLFNFFARRNKIL